MIYNELMDENKFGYNLKFLRKKMGMTQKQLGEQIGVGQVAIANYEKGQRFPGEKNLMDLVKVLDVSLDRLMGLDGYPGGVSEDLMEFSAEQLWNRLLKDSADRVLDYLLAWQKDKSWELPVLYEKVITPLLLSLGQLWLGGNLTIAEEHLLTGKIRTLIILLSHYTSDRRKHLREGRRWLGLCPPGEDHDLGLLMLAGTMEYAGWDVRNLGINIPVSDLLQIVESFRPRVVSFSCINPHCLNGLDSYIRALREKSSYSFQIQVGGSGIHRDFREEDSVVYAENLFESVRLAEETIGGGTV